MDCKKRQQICLQASVTVFELKSLPVKAGSQQSLALAYFDAGEHWNDTKYESSKVIK